MKKNLHIYLNLILLSLNVFFVLSGCSLSKNDSSSNADGNSENLYNSIIVNTENGGLVDVSEGYDGKVDKSFSINLNNYYFNDKAASVLVAGASLKELGIIDIGTDLYDFSVSRSIVPGIYTLYVRISGDVRENISEKFTITLKKEWLTRDDSSIKKLDENIIVSGVLSPIGYDTRPLPPAGPNVTSDMELRDGVVELVTKDGVVSDSVTVSDDGKYVVNLGDKSGKLYLVITALNALDRITKWNNPDIPVPTITGDVSVQYPKIPHDFTNEILKNYKNKKNTKRKKDVFYEWIPFDSAQYVVTDELASKQVQKKNTPENNYYVSPYTSLKVGDKKNVFMYYTKDFQPHVLKVKKKVGDRVLYIFDKDKSNVLTDEFINNVANYFLNDSSNNIWNLCNVVFGDEWGPIPNWNNNWNTTGFHKYPVSNNGHRIGNENQREVVIFFTPLNSVNDRLGGYAWSADTFVKNYMSVYSSNEAVCFYINSEMFKDDLPGCLTTLAHEFQHAISNYQRYKFGYNKKATNISYVQSDVSTTMTELFSTLAEEMVANILNVSGPGNNDMETGFAPSDEESLINGRIPVYLMAHRFDCMDYDGTSNVDAVYPYGLNFSLGGYLVRNYGTGFIKEYQNAKSYDDYSNMISILTDSLNKSNNRNNSSISWEKILRGWGCAVLLSDCTDASYPFKFSTKNSDNDYWFKNVFYPDSKIASVNFWPFKADVEYLGYREYASNEERIKLSSTGPFVFNSLSDRQYSLIENGKIATNTNTFVILNDNASGVLEYNISSHNDLIYTFVLK